MQAVKGSADKEEACRVLGAMAKVLMDEGTHESRFKEAVDMYRTAHKLRKRSMEIAYRLGIALYRANRIDEAIVVYKVRVPLRK